MRVVVLDTDVASSLLRRRAPDTIARQLAGNVAAVTFVTVGELIKWTLVRQWGSQIWPPCLPFSRAVVLPDDQRAASRWGELQAYARQMWETDQAYGDFQADLYTHAASTSRGASSSIASTR